MRLCGICHQPVDSPLGQVMHPTLESGILCGTAGKRTFPYEGEPVPQDRASEAQRHLSAVMAALRYHEEHEGAPVEVNTGESWVDATTLLAPLLRTLGLPGYQ